MDKKGGFQFGNFVMYSIYLLPVILVIVIGFYLISGMLNSQITDTSPFLEKSTIMNRFAYSPNCFAFQDDANLRAYSLVIDAEKFDSDHLDNCMLFARGIKTELYYDKEKITLETDSWVDGGEASLMTKKVIVVDEGIYEGLLGVWIQDG